MGIYNFDLVIDRRSSDSVKWDRDIIAHIGNNPDAEPFWVADMDFSPPPAVTEALFNRISHPVFGYPENTGIITSSFISWLKWRHNWAVPENQVLFTPGMLAGVSAAIQVLSRKGEGVILQTPAYQPFFHLIEGNGREIIRNQLLRSDSMDSPVSDESCSSPNTGKQPVKFLIDFDDLEQKMADPRNTVMVLCSPHNPAGRVWTREELTRVAKLCELHGVAVISDEIHADLSYPGHTHTPFSTVSGTVPQVTCMAPSKTFNIAGEKIAFAVSTHPSLLGDIRKHLEAQAISHPSILAPVAAAAAYSNGREWVTELVTYLRGNLSLMREFIEEKIPELTVMETEASFIAFLDCSRLIPLLSGEKPAKFFSRKAGVLLHDGRWFGPEGSQYARINFGTQRARLTAALERMAEAVRELR